MGVIKIFMSIIKLTKLKKMKKIKLLLLLSLFAAFFVISCSKSSSGDEELIPEEVTSDYYMIYKINGIAVSAAEFTALRGTEGDKNTLTLQASAKKGASPQLKFYHGGSFIGIVGGLHINSIDDKNSDYLNYTDSKGILYTTQFDKDGVDLILQDVVYKKDGTVEGRFSGFVTAENKSRVEITDGKFRIKFSN